ncbi:collagen alpha-1(I) chain-like [Motacilla alba alba]|uniref:collagen alpha-1(I) chain-like n=1 Tax=Motacilla alba alba TaxID=1094192 RepID=UPI0018D50D11|nr:collagen alpha-1(I) chain-like [Motacilla alba alba]
MAGAGRCDPPFPAWPEGGGLGLKGFVGPRQPFLREPPAAVPSSGEPEIVRCEGRGAGCRGCRGSANPFGAASRAPRGSGAAGSGSLRERSRVSQCLSPPPAGQPEPSRLLPRESPELVIEGAAGPLGAALPSPARRESRGCCGITELSPGGPQPRALPCGPKSPKNPGGRTPLLLPSRCCCCWRPESPPTPSVACPGVTLLEFQPNCRIPACSCALSRWKRKHMKREMSFVLPLELRCSSTKPGLNPVAGAAAQSRDSQISILVPMRVVGCVLGEVYGVFLTLKNVPCSTWVTQLIFSTSLLYLNVSARINQAPAQKLG